MKKSHQVIDSHTGLPVYAGTEQECKFQLATTFNTFKVDGHTSTHEIQPIAYVEGECDMPTEPVMKEEEMLTPDSDSSITY